MLDNSKHFIYSFLILFLCILFVMFAMFAVVRHFDPDLRSGKGLSTAADKERETSAAKKDTFRDLTALYRANLFAIDLCLIVLVETTLIILFVKFTVPAALVATLVMIYVTLSMSDEWRSESLQRFFSRFVTNGHATLSHTDMMLLIVLSGTIMSFLMSALLKQSGITTVREEAPQSASPLSPPPPDASGPPPPPLSS
jgi:hypothetical protein